MVLVACWAYYATCTQTGKGFTISIVTVIVYYCYYSNNDIRNTILIVIMLWNKVFILYMLDYELVAAASIEKHPNCFIVIMVTIIFTFLE